MTLAKTLRFLNGLIPNNNKEWFTDNKKLYLEAKQEFEEAVEEWIDLAKEIDPAIDVFDPKKCTFRFYRDTRFSKDKTPYKSNFGAFINPQGKKSPYCGFYMHIEPGESFVAGGVMPDADALQKIRKGIFNNPEKLKAILNDPNFKNTFDGLSGDKLKRAPRGFPPDFKDINLLKPKHYAVVHYVRDGFWTSDNLNDKLKTIFKTVFPFNDFINGILRKAI